MEADSSFARVLAATPDYASAWLYRAKTATRIDTSETSFLAKPYYEKYIELASVDPTKNKKGLIESYMYMGNYAAQNDQNDLAIEYFSKVIALDPANEDAANFLKLLQNR